jgi:hypothetical protein
MSYYGRGRVSSDFCGLARQVRQQEMPGCLQVYFTGCAGNTAPGKYNDGSVENRPILRDRMYAAMKSAWKDTVRHPVSGWESRAEPVRFKPRVQRSFGEPESRKVLENPKESKARRGNAAFQLAWLKRIERPIDLTCLDFGKAAILHLPGEPFIEYQLRAQSLRKDAFVCVAGYGDDGPGYIPIAEAYFQGGYEITVALASPESDSILTSAIKKLLDSK